MRRAFMSITLLVLSLSTVMVLLMGLVATENVYLCELLDE